MPIPPRSGRLRKTGITLRSSGASWSEVGVSTLRELNYAVYVQGKSPEIVAGNWLRENGFIE